MKTLKRYSVITFSIFIMAIGIYFFKFPHNFVFGGITGLAVVVAKIFTISAPRFIFFANIILLIIGLFLLGRDFAIRTGYASMLLSFFLLLFERIYPLSRPLSNEPMLELIFAISLPAIASGLLFFEEASSGGTDVIAMLIKKFTDVNTGLALFFADLVFVIIACFIFDIKTALYSFVGLTTKSFIVDGVINNMNLCKSFTIICETPEPICDYIVNDLKRSATITEGKGAYTKQQKYIIYTVLRKKQSVALKSFLHNNSPDSFILVSNSSEILGNGFLKL